MDVATSNCFAAGAAPVDPKKWAGGEARRHPTQEKFKKGKDARGEGHDDARSQPLSFVLKEGKGASRM